MVTIKQMEAVYWVYTLASFRAAADKLNTTPSAVSKRVRDIEVALNLEIFKAGNRTELTIAGRELAQDFADILALCKKVTDKFQDPRAYSGYFRLGVTEIVAINWLPQIISSIKSRYPKMTLESNVDMATNLVRKVESNLLDIVISPHVPNLSDTLSSDDLCRLECDWMISKDLLPEGASVDVEKIFDYPLLMHSEGSVFYNELQRTLRRYRLQPKEKIYCGSMTALAELANNRLGLAYLPSRSAIIGKATNLRTIKLPLKPPQLKYCAIHNNDSLCVDVVNMIRPIFLS